MLQAAKAAGQITHVHNRKIVVPDDNNAFTLEQAGIDRKLSMRSQQIADVPKEEFIVYFAFDAGQDCPVDDFADRFGKTESSIRHWLVPLLLVRPVLF